MWFALELHRPGGTAHPQHAIEIDASLESGCRIEAIGRVDQSDDLSARGRRRHRGQEHARASGRARPEDFRHFPAPPATAELRINRGHATRQQGVPEGTAQAGASVTSSFGPGARTRAGQWRRIS